MRNEMLRGRVLRYMYAFRLSRCGTRVAVCQQHFAKRHLTQSRNDENDFSFFSLSFLLPLSLFLPAPLFFLFQHDCSLPIPLTRWREKKTTIIRGRLDAKISSTTGRCGSRAPCILTLYRLSRNRSAMIFAIAEASWSASLSLQVVSCREIETRSLKVCAENPVVRKAIVIVAISPHHWPVYPCPVVS